MRNWKTLWVTVLAAFAFSSAAFASPVVFNGTSGDLSASVGFDLVDGNLVATLTNTSTADVTAPGDVLTAVFFDVAGAPTFLPVSAILASGSTALFGSTGPGGVVGGEWAYKSGLSGAPASYGISSSGLSLFGPFDRFPGSNLEGPDSPGGIEYGITSAGDNPATGNTPVTGTNALIQNAVQFTLSGVPSGFDLSQISNVSFQYGTSLSETRFPGTEVPEPATFGLAGGAIALLGVARAIRRKSAKACE